MGLLLISRGERERSMRTPAYRPRYQCKTKDCQAILESIRRLLEGTWELQDDDLAYAWDLLPRIDAALSTHIENEEELLFDALTPQQRTQHELGHLCLMEQLAQVHAKLVNLDSTGFHIALATLVLLLDSHHREFDDQVAQIEQSGCDCRGTEIL